MIGDDTRAGLAVDTLMSHGAVNVSSFFHAAPRGVCCSPGGTVRSVPVALTCVSVIFSYLRARAPVCVSVLSACGLENILPQK